MVTIKGIIIPRAWDERGGVTAMGLAGFDEKEYSLEGNFEKSDFLNHLQEKVEITGIVGKRKDGEFTLKVHRWRVIPSSSAV